VKKKHVLIPAPITESAIKMENAIATKASKEQTVQFLTALTTAQEMELAKITDVFAKMDSKDLTVVSNNVPTTAIITDSAAKVPAIVTKDSSESTALFSYVKMNVPSKEAVITESVNACQAGQETTVQ